MFQQLRLNGSEQVDCIQLVLPPTPAPAASGRSRSLGARSELPVSQFIDTHVLLYHMPVRESSRRKGLQIERSQVLKRRMRSG